MSTEDSDDGLLMTSDDVMTGCHVSTSCDSRHVLFATRWLLRLGSLRGVDAAQCELHSSDGDADS